MKFRIIFLLFFLNCCVPSSQNTIKNTESFVPYNSKGFALIYEEEDFKNKIVSKKLDSEKFQVAHRKLGRNKILILTN